MSAHYIQRETWLRPSRTPSSAVGRESVPHREMTLGADVAFGPRRRERLFDINNPAGWAGSMTRM